MAKNVQAIRGMHDVLPENSKYWQFLDACVERLMSVYHYEHVRLPILEKTELFKRTIGEVTDIVEKEMYTFEDRNGDSLSLRPEGTAGCVRAALEHGLLHNQTQKLWYSGPMFRHERPQKGRYRQFYQIGVEAFGMQGPDIDAELIVMTRRLWKMLGLLPYVELQLNTLGTTEERHVFKEALVVFLNQHKDQLDEDSQRRIETNPLRVLDSKNPNTQSILADAPVLLDFLGEESLAHFESLKAQLDSVGVTYTINPRLVRGLDYYSRTVFEWVTTHLGAQGTVCAGGRFDKLVEMLGGKTTSAVGFAMGVERLIALMQDLETVKPERLPDVYMVLAGEQAERMGISLAESLRDELPEMRLVQNHGGGSFKSQLKRADKSGAAWAMIIGDDEIAEGVAAMKPLRGGEQQVVRLEELPGFFKQQNFNG